MEMKIETIKTLPALFGEVDVLKSVQLLPVQVLLPAVWQMKAVQTVPLSVLSSSPVLLSLTALLSLTVLSSSMVLSSLTGPGGTTSSPSCRRPFPAVTMQLLSAWCGPSMR